MQSEKSEGRDMWATESLVSFLKGAQEDGTLAKIATRFHEIDLDQVI